MLFLGKKKPKQTMPGHTDILKPGLLFHLTMQ